MKRLVTRIIPRDWSDRVLGGIFFLAISGITMWGSLREVPKDEMYLILLGLGVLVGTIGIVCIVAAFRCDAQY